GARAHDRRGNYCALDYGARDWPLDRRDAFAFRSCPARYLAGARLRSAQRFREDFRSPKTSHAQTAFEVRRKMAPLSLDRGLVFLARTRSPRARLSVTTAFWSPLRIRLLYVNYLWQCRKHLRRRFPRRRLELRVCELPDWQTGAIDFPHCVL